jgi:microcin C transport system ATP-binding protein
MHSLPPEGALAASEAIPRCCKCATCRVRFGAKEVVRGVDFDIAPGEKLALVGESGSGKTITALSLLRWRVMPKSAASAMLRGRDLLSLSEREMRGVRGGEIAMVFQEPMTALNPLMTVGQQIAEVLELKKALTPAQSAQAAIELLASTGIPEPERRAGAYPHQLSGGQRQRAMIAMALASEARAAAGRRAHHGARRHAARADPGSAVRAAARSGMAVLLITHDLNLVRRFADRVAVMEQGVLVEQGSVADVFARRSTPTPALIASQPRRDVARPRCPKARPRWCRRRTCAWSTPRRCPASGAGSGRANSSPCRGPAATATGPHAGRGGGIGLGQVHAGAGGAGPAAVTAASWRWRGRAGSSPPRAIPANQRCAARCRWCSRTRFRRSRRA